MPTLEITMQGMPDFDKAVQAYRDLRPQIVRKLGRQLEWEVRESIRQSGINDAHGKVQSWQQVRYGSGGGYAAVSAARGKTGQDSPGAITNYLESGHKTRRPSGTAEHYRPRINKTRTTAYGFYRSSKSKADQLTRNAALEVEQKLAGVL